MPEPTPIQGSAKRTVWLVAGKAVYRIVRADETTIRCVIEAGSDRVRDRFVNMPRSQVEAAVALGEMRSTARRPKIIDEQLQQKQVSKVEQEAALSSQGSADGIKQRVIRKGKVRD